MKELIALLEAATVGSRELDHRIWCALNGRVFVSVEFDEVSKTEHFIYQGEPTGEGFVVPQWTKTVENALKLVPRSEFPGIAIMSACYGPNNIEGWNAGIARGEVDGNAFSISLPCAICAARLDVIARASGANGPRGFGARGDV